MSKKGLSFFELHAEKIALGVAGAFTLGLVGWYLTGIPNRIEYNGESVGPRELDTKILQEAQDLQRRVRNAQAKTESVPPYAETLKKQFQSSLIAESGLPAALPLAASFGQPLPEIKETEESASKVEVVKPLAPLQMPLVGTGRSVIVRHTGAPGEQPGAAREGENKPVETSWATIKAFFPEDAQRDAMTAAGYATHLQKVFIAGVESQRQEILSNGEWSDWQDVPLSKAMTKVEIPDPVVDEQTGDLLNRDAIDQALQAVRVNQARLLQPPFYEVTDGDKWKAPEVEQETETPEDRPKPPPKKTPPDKRPTPGAGRGAPSPPPMPSGGGGGGGGRGGRGVGGGRGGAVGVGGPPGGAGFDNSAAKAKAAAKQKIKQDLTEAEKALKDKEWDKAQGLASGVQNHPDATNADRTRAQRIMDDVDRGRPKEQAPPVQGGGGGRGMTSGGGRSSGPPVTTGGRGAGQGFNPYAPQGGKGGRGGGEPGPAPLPDAPLVVDEKDNPAIWFHDDSVEPGKTYRYRLRIKLWNRYVGRMKQLADPAQARLPVLAGEWSLPSDPITIAPSTHFYVSGPAIGEAGARADVFKWRKGKWVKETFGVKVGDTIGAPKEVKLDDKDDEGKSKSGKTSIDFATGALVLDVRLEEPVKIRTAAGTKGEYRLADQTSVVVTYLDPVDGQVKERVQALDRNDPLYKKLKESEG